MHPSTATRGAWARNSGSARRSCPQIVRDAFPLRAPAHQGVGMRPRPLPRSLAGGSFTTTDAYAAGVGRKVLRGPAVRRLHVGVYVARGQVLGVRDEVAAARLALPAPTLVTGVTALWCFGVEVGRPRPLQFVTSHPHQVRRPGL